MAPTGTLAERALARLARWAAATEADWHAADDDPAVGCYGPGYPHWGTQSNWNCAAALATLAAHAQDDEAAKWRARALATLRFLLQTHVTGGRPGNDGKRWGNNWISMLGIERAMHGLARLADAFDPADRAALRRVLVSEADWLLLHGSRGAHAGVCAGLWASEGRNNPESNVWSGCLLWRVAHLYPDEPHAADWRELGHTYLVNGISTQADARDSTPVAGRAVADRHVGANFFPHYALDHHGYLNVGYMVICMSNAAMLHFDLKRAGLPLPESLYHHQADLWQVLRRMVFGDGRLARIGGDSRVRYAYGQEYLLPTLLFAADRFRDPYALELADRQVAWIEREAAAGDGSFYGSRLAPMRRENPHYYMRLESDRACVLAMLVNDLPLVTTGPDQADPAASATGASFARSAAGGWMEEAHGAVLHRSPGRLSSFAWRAHGLAQALCLPPDDGSLAEWSSNLCPVVRFLGDTALEPGRHRRLLAHHVESFAGGFTACGAVMEGVDVRVDEGGSCTDQAVTQIAFAALPDDRTCLCLQYVRAAPDRVGYLAELKDLHLAVPNDVFNGFRRTVRSAAGETELVSPPRANEALELPGRWINVDDRLGAVALYGGDRFLIERSVARRAGRYASLFVEQVCLHVQSDVQRCRPGQVLVDVGFAVLAGVTAESTARVRGGAVPVAQEGIRAAWVEGADGRPYALAANFGDKTQTVRLAGLSFELAASAAVLKGPLDPAGPG